MTTKLMNSIPPPSGTSQSCKTRFQTTGYEHYQLSSTEYASQIPVCMVLLLAHFLKNISPKIGSLKGIRLSQIK